MKKILAVLVVAMFTTATFAQDKKETTAPMKADTKSMPECYMMKNGTLMHCKGDKEVAQTKNVVLKNGTSITPKGEVKIKGQDASKKLENGQCISLMGSIGSCDQMHSMEKETKQAPAQPTPPKQTK